MAGKRLRSRKSQGVFKHPKSTTKSLYISLQTCWTARSFV